MFRWLQRCWEPLVNGWGIGFPSRSIFEILHVVMPVWHRCSSQVFGHEPSWLVCAQVQLLSKTNTGTFAAQWMVSDYNLCGTEKCSVVEPGSLPWSPKQVVSHQRQPVFTPQRLIDAQVWKRQAGARQHFLGGGDDPGRLWDASTRPSKGVWWMGISWIWR